MEGDTREQDVSSILIDDLILLDIDGWVLIQRMDGFTTWVSRHDLDFVEPGGGLRRNYV
jgi:hypothetical protein